MVGFKHVLLTGTLLSTATLASPIEQNKEKRTVDTRYPYKGPTVPIADWVDQTVNGNGEGYYRLHEPPAVAPKKANPTNNINVINLAYVPGGMNVHFQTAYGLGVNPTVRWGTSQAALTNTATGTSSTYDRTPPCSMYDKATECSQFFHNVQITNLKSNSKYYYQIQAANGTTESDVLSFTTSMAAGETGAFNAILLNDMGYTNARGTHREMNKLLDEGGASFALHGGDTSYADDFMYGIEDCYDAADGDEYHCWAGPDSTHFPEGYEDPVYKKPLPAGEDPSYGGPYGGDMSTIYESNWDLWQQWMTPITTRIPYMINPGNHEASCAENDVGTVLSAYFTHNVTDSEWPDYDLNYYSCPESQRNFTAYQYRFRMPGDETGGKTNFWYSFDYGLVHFISFNTETDFAYSPETNFLTDTEGRNATPIESDTKVNNAGPFGYIDGWGANTFNTSAYEQYQWMAADLAAVDRSVTPWVIMSGHHPMYSSATAGYQAHLRNAFEALWLKHGVDMYVAGHVHWWERMFPMGLNGTIDSASVIDRNTYRTNPGTSITHVINGMAGNIETHVNISAVDIRPMTNVLNNKQFGFSKLTVFNSTALQVQYIKGNNGDVGDSFFLLKD